MFIDLSCATHSLVTSSAFESMGSKSLPVVVQSIFEGKHLSHVLLHVFGDMLLTEAHLALDNVTSRFPITSATLMFLYIIDLNAALFKCFTDSIGQLYDSDDEVTTVRILDCHIFSIS